MWRLRLLYLGHRYVPMRPDSFLLLSGMLLIIGAGAVSLYLSSEQPALLTIGAGFASMALLLAAMLQFPGIADGLSWIGLIVEELNSSSGVIPDTGRGAARRQIVRRLQEHGAVPDDVVRQWLRASR